MQGFEDDLTGVINAADNLNDDVNVVALDEAHGIIRKKLCGNAVARLRSIVDCYATDLNIAADALDEMVTILGEQSIHCLANGAITKEGDAHGFTVSHLCEIPCC